MWWVLITSGNNDGEIRRVESFATSTITVSVAFSNQVATSVTFELHRIYPVLIHNALNRASADLFHWLYIPVRNDTLIVDNLLSNALFRTFSAGVHTGWTLSGSGSSVANETTRVVKPGSSAAVTAGGAVAAQYTQDLFTSVNIHDVAGKTLHFACWVWASEASAGRLRITFDGSTYTEGSYHAGSSEWENERTMHVDAVVPDDATEMTVVLEVAASQTVYFGFSYASIDPIRQYAVPEAFNELYRVLVQEDANKPWGGGAYRSLAEGERPKRGRILRLIGKGQLSNLTVDTSTVEIGEPQTQLLIAQALSYIYRNLQGDSFADQSQRAFYLEQEARWFSEAERLKRTPGIRLHGMAAEYPRAWKVEEDQEVTASLGRYIVFDW